MKKILSAILAFSLMTVMLAACNKNEGEETTSAEQTTVYTEENTGSSENIAGEGTTAAPEETTQETVTADNTTQSSVQETTTGVTETTSSQAEAPSSENTVTEAPSSEVPSTNAPVSGQKYDNEYDILRSGNFHIKGTMTDNSGLTSPLEMAVTPNSIYMLSEFSEGVDIAVLLSNKKFYMIYPAKKAYMEMNESIMKTVGLDINAMLESGNVDFTAFGSLEEATKVTEELYNGSVCKVYQMDDPSGGTAKAYMNGDRLVRFASYSDEGYSSVMDIYSISSSVPADRSAPPADYKAYSGVAGIFSFMSLMSDVMM